MAVDWDLLKAVRAAIKAGKDIPAVKVEELCKTIEDQDKTIAQKTQEYDSLHAHNLQVAAKAEALSERAVELMAAGDEMQAELASLKGQAAEGAGDGAA
jgi:hypothetical protein